VSEGQLVGHGQPSTGATYPALNSAINEAIFGGRFRFVPVYLLLEDDMVELLSARFGLSPDRFPVVLGRVVAKTLHWTDRDPYFGHLRELDLWNRRGRVEPPPFSALLCTLSLAAESMRQDDNYSSSNYYQRLFEVLNIDDPTYRNKLKSNAKSTLKFWEALNSWLAENDFEFGRPTAKPVNHWKYVSYALSQALIREADRRRLRDLFVEFGLSPHERLSESQFTLYLLEWMQGPGPSAWLKKLWSVRDLRPKVASAARAELESWDGTEICGDSGERLRRTLSWAAQLITFPRRELQLYLTIARGDADSSRLSVPANSSRAASEAFADCDEGVWLCSVPTGEFSVLEPTQRIRLNALMQASFELEDPHKEVTLKHVARPVVPLAKLESGPYYREVSRASLLRRHLVLASDRCKDQVEAYLSSYARASYTALTSNELVGLANGWVLFTNVEIIRIAEDVSDDLQPLVPLLGEAVLEIHGGLKLEQDLWHFEAPPEIECALDRGPVTLELRERSADGSLQTIAQKESASSTAELQLSGLSLRPDSEFVACVSGDRRDQTEDTFSLRSADKPRPLRSSNIPELAYYLSPDLLSGLYSASGEVPAPATGLVIRGLKVETVGQPQGDTSDWCPPEPLELLARADEHEDDEDLPSPSYSVRAFIPSEPLRERGHRDHIVRPPAPHNHPDRRPELIRYLPSLPGGRIVIYDELNKVLLIDRSRFYRLRPNKQREVLRTARYSPV
jgi:hypothetical protein